jgi:hypothetical protein
VTSVVRPSKRFVYVCTDSDCAKDKKKLRSLTKTISAEATVKNVKCQKLCEGPVAGVFVNGDLIWFERLTSAKHRESLLRLLQTNKLSKSLKKHQNKSRAGKLR